MGKTNSIKAGNKQKIKGFSGNGNIIVAGDLVLQRGEVYPSSKSEHLSLIAYLESEPYFVELIKTGYINQRLIGSDGNIHEALKFTEKAMNSNNYMVVFGESGIGKSTYCEYMWHYYAINFAQNSNSNVFPIIIKLRDYDLYKTAESILKQFFSRNNIVAEEFSSLRKSTKILLLLDGLDEAPSKETAITIYRAIANLSLLGNYACFSIITVRPHFFEDLDEEMTTKGILLSDGHKIISCTIDSFKKEDIYQFIEKRNQLPEKVFAFIKQIYDLEGLSSNPMLLSMIIEAIKDGKLRDLRKVDRAIIYEKFIENWMEKEKIRVVRTGLLFPQDKIIIILEQLAFNMYLKGVSP